MVLPKNLPATLALRRVTLAPGLLLFAIGLALRLYRLGTQSLWLDEGGTWAEVSGRTGKGWPALLGELFSQDAAYPLYHVLLKAWVALAGDSEWALRFPSALAGAATVLVIYLAARKLDRRPPQDKEMTSLPLSHSPDLLVSTARGRWSVVGTIAALLFATSPFALWYGQDAKVYSLLMLAVALQLWALLIALRHPGPRAWLILLSVSLISLFVHRLALLPAAGAALAYVVAWPTNDQRPTIDDQQRASRKDERSSFVIRRWSLARIAVALLTLALAAAGVAGAILAVRGESRGTGGHISAGPLQALGLTFTRFSLDRWPGDLAGYLWLPLALLPCVALTIWGLALLGRDALAGRQAAIAILCMLAAPLALLTLALALMAVPIYEARYATAAFPAWVLTLAYPFRKRRNLTLLNFLLVALLLINALMLVQPNKGLFSGAAVKEQWREAITYLARRAHPDDLVIVHPYYVSPMWDYYAPRVTADPLPQPVIFPVFAGGDCTKTNPDPAQELECIRRKYNEPFFNQQAFGKKRALLLIAPEHAKTVDPPKTLAQLQAEYKLAQHKPGAQPPTQDDTYGWVGLRFQFSSDQRTWPCGGERYLGVEVMCQSYPETYNAGGSGKTPQPATPLDATFGAELHLRGYSLDLLGGVARPGGTLPVTLYWDAAAKPTHDYQMFLHLCRDCTLPPLASDDNQPPLQGYLPAGKTSTWQLHDPLHDERAVILPADLPPGRYTLLLGVYPPNNPSETARLPVVSKDAQILGGTRLILGQVTISQP